MTDADTMTTRRARRRGLGRRAVTTVAAWAGAYLVVNLVVMIGGRPLAAAPRAVQTMVISGTLVIVMTNALMPVISRGVARLFANR